MEVLEALIRLIFCLGVGLSASKGICKTGPMAKSPSSPSPGGSGCGCGDGGEARDVTPFYGGGERERERERPTILLQCP